MIKKFIYQNVLKSYTAEIVLSENNINVPASGLNARSITGDIKIYYNKVLRKTISNVVLQIDTAPSWVILNNNSISVASRGTTVGNALSGSISLSYDTLETDTGGKSLHLTSSITISQEANIKNYTSFTLEFNTPNPSWVIDKDAVPASGGYVHVSGYKVYTYTSGSETSELYNMLQTQAYSSVAWATLYGTSGSTTTFNGVKVESRGAVVGEARSGYMYVIVDGIRSNNMTFTQNANEATSITYGSMVVSLSYPKVSASGGTSSPTMSYSQSRTQNYTSGSTSTLSPATSGGLVSYSRVSGGGILNSSTGVVTASSRGTTVDSTDTTVGVFKVSVNLNNKTGDTTASVFQTRNQATTIDYGTPSVAYSYPKASAAGGTINPTVTYSQSRTQNYTSGSTSTLSAITSGATLGFTKQSGSGTLNSSTGAVTVSSRGTTIDSADTTQFTGTCTVTLNGKSGYDTASVIQTRNVRTTIRSNWFTIPPYANISAAGETKQCSNPWIQYNYTSGAYDAFADNSGVQVPISQCTLTSNQTWAPVNSSGVITVASRGTTYGEARSFTITCTYGGISSTTTRTQNANYVTSVAIHKCSGNGPVDAAYLTGSAAGGNKCFASWLTYSSGSSGEGMNVIDTANWSLVNNWGATWESSAGAFNTNYYGYLYYPSRGTTIGPARTATLTLSLNSAATNNKALSASVTYTQELNRVINCTNANSNFSYTSGIPAAGGTRVATVYASAQWGFSSGSVSEYVGTGSQFGGTIARSDVWSGTNGNGFTLNTSNGSVTAASKGTTISGVTTSNEISRTCTWTFTNPSSVGGQAVSRTAVTAKRTIQQAANNVEAIAAVPSIGNSVATSYSPTTITASGGTSSPVISGSCKFTFSSTATALQSSAGTYYGYALTFSRTYSMPTSTGFSLNTSTGVVTAANRGITEGSARSATVTITFTANWNGKTSSRNDTSTITQQANTKTYDSVSIEWHHWDETWQPTPSSVRAAGGALGIKTFPKYVYSSGSVDTFALGPNTSVLTSSVSWATARYWSSGNLSGITIENRGTVTGDARTGTVYATYQGKTSNTLTFTQVANTVTYDKPRVFGKYPSTIAAGGGTTGAPTITYKQIATYSSGSTSNITSGASITYKTWGSVFCNFHNDILFEAGNNGLVVYDNNASGKTTLTRITGTNPIGGTHLMRVSNTGSGPTPNLGGFYYALSKQEDVSQYVFTFIAKLPSTHAIEFRTNTIGTSGYSNYWLTSNVGTGDYQTYSYYVIFGSGPLSSTGFFSMVGPAGTDSSPVIMDIASAYIVWNKDNSSSIINTSTGSLTVPSLGTTVSTFGEVVTPIRQAVADVVIKLNGQQSEINIVPAVNANVATYGALTGGAVSAADIPASGGTRTASVTNMTQTVSYTSGSTRAGTINNSQSAAITGSNLGSTVKARTKLGSITVTFTGEGSKTATKSVDVYQQANSLTVTDTPTGSFSYNDVSASGGTSLPIVNIYNNASFTSGSTGTVSPKGIMYEMIGGAGTLNTNTGAISYSANTSSSRTTSVKAVVPYYNSSNSAIFYATCTQSGVPTTNVELEVQNSSSSTISIGDIELWFLSNTATGVGIEASYRCPTMTLSAGQSKVQQITLTNPPTKISVWARCQRVSRYLELEVGGSSNPRTYVSSTPVKITGLTSPSELAMSCVLDIT